MVCIENRLYDVLLESFWRDVPNVRVRKNTMPLAICYAALKAIKETERLEGGAAMRDVRFQGKQVDTGEWVYGTPAMDDDGICYIVIKIIR